MTLETVGIMNVFNEADILEENLDYLNEQGLKLLLVDNGSTDGSYEIARRYLTKNVVRLDRLQSERFSVNALAEHDLKLIQQHNPDWVLWVDADEFFEPPTREMTLVEAIEQEAAKGYNVIQFDNFEFWPTEKDLQGESGVRARLRFYSWRDDYHFKCWKWVPKSSYDMHRPLFPRGVEQKISPTKFVIRHYKIRSYEHGMRKVFEERLKRIDPEEKAKGVSVHYDLFTKARDLFVVQSDKLTEYHEDGVWNRERRYDMTVGVQMRLRALDAYLKDVSAFPPDAFDLLLRLHSLLEETVNLLKKRVGADVLSDRLAS